MTFKPPRWPVVSDVSLGGTVTFQRLANKPSGAVLGLEFEAIDDDAAAAVLQSYFDSKGSDQLLIPEICFRGAKPSLRAFLDCSHYQGLTWHFIPDSVPDVRRSKTPGRSSLSLQLQAVVRFAA